MDGRGKIPAPAFGHVRDAPPVVEYVAEFALSLAHITNHISTAAQVRELVAAVQSDRRAVVADLPESARPVIIAAALHTIGRPALIITSRQDRAEQLCSAMSEYLPPDHPAHLWSAPDALPYEMLPTDRDGSVRRTRELDAMSRATSNHGIWVAPVSGLMQRIMSPQDLEDHTRTIRLGHRISVDDLFSWALTVGYQPGPMVQEQGVIARRGGILDIFPPGETLPVRIDFFGDDVESIRRFDPHTQRSVDRLTTIRLLPPFELPVWQLPTIATRLSTLDLAPLRDEVREDWQRRIQQVATGAFPDSLDLLSGYLTPDASSLLDFLPNETVVIVDQPDAVRLAATQYEQQAIELERTFRESGELPTDLPLPYISSESVLGSLTDRTRIVIGASDTGQAGAISFDGIGDSPIFAGNITTMIDRLRELLGDGWKISIATDQVERLIDIVEEWGVYPRKDKRGRDSMPAPLPAGAVEIRPSDLTGGWSWSTGKLAVWTDLELFGFRKRVRRSGQRTNIESRTFAQSLQPGEHVVHVDHGIAKFSGLIRMEIQEIEREYLLLEYARGDKLYVPVDQSDRVTRYSGGGLNPTLNRLGSGEWVRTKRKVRRAVREMAFELIQLYAFRESGKGYAFPPGSRWDQELAESFPFVETPDQAKAIAAVESDMESYRPMDRLVCGDVGFGKTEIAIRAAFKAVNAGKQVAILVPTTVLALQHFTTFRDRLSAFPVRIEMLSRLKSRSAQEQILRGLKDGSVDIVIGTHRLVQRDVQFKDLGLAVIDEEQRFGVRQKEFLKQLRTEVDVLTMSATPIPRTLHLSLSGIRDISMIETAPQARLPIRTFVTAFTDQLIREVILREMERGGQVFVVHNRVHDIDVLAERLRKAVPEARFGVGHGQMDEHVLEEVMLGFIRHEFDVLISTTIIESGVDIPNVNTIIIDNADTLGLTQLYQLRGRVGRSSHRAYAYLLHQPHKSIRGEALERLETIQEATELGAGLRVAMRDLEIRGAGNILGAEQSGHIATVGYELYMRLLSQAVEEVRSGQPALEQGPITLDLPMTALIPDDYIADTELRLNLYRQIAAVQSLEEVRNLEDELIDRFGDFPEEVEHVFALIRLRIRSAALGIDSVVEREREIVIRPVATSELDRDRLARAVGDALRLTPNSVRIRLLELGMPWQQALDAVLVEIERASPEVMANAAD
jgi:transcription-repair coupling factor (superfamily II helicase)